VYQRVFNWIGNVEVAHEKDVFVFGMLFLALCVRSYLCFAALTTVQWHCQSSQTKRSGGDLSRPMEHHFKEDQTCLC